MSNTGFWNRPGYQPVSGLTLYRWQLMSQGVPGRPSTFLRSCDPCSRLTSGSLTDHLPPTTNTVTTVKRRWVAYVQSLDHFATPFLAGVPPVWKGNGAEQASPWFPLHLPCSDWKPRR